MDKQKKKKLIFFSCLIVSLATCIILLYPLLQLFVPLTKFEARLILKDVDFDQQNLSDLTRVAAAVNCLNDNPVLSDADLFIGYLDCSWDYAATGYYRGYGSEHGDTILFLANEALEQATGFDFGYDEGLDCESETNQAAIKAWQDWYENQE